MLYYLSKVKGLRVLAMTWEIPFMSENAKKSVENAKKAFSNVEFISRTVSREDLRRVYRKLFALSGNTCACPSLAYVLFSGGKRAGADVGALLQPHGAENGLFFRG